MQIQNGTKLFVVRNSGCMSEMTFGNLTDALKGGRFRMEEIEVFTDREEAEQVDRANKRRQQVARFSAEELLEATKMTLTDAEGRVIQEIPLCQLLSFKAGTPVQARQAP